MSFLPPNHHCQSTEGSVAPTLAIGLTESFLHPPPDSWRRGVAPFMRAVWCQYQFDYHHQPCRRYGDSVGNTVGGELWHLLPSPIALVAVSKRMLTVRLLQQNPPVLNWGCWLTQIVLCNGSKMVVGASISHNFVFFNCVCRVWTMPYLLPVPSQDNVERLSRDWRASGVKMGEGWWKWVAD